jgi:hypothetical protein
MLDSLRAINRAKQISVLVEQGRTVKPYTEGNLEEGCIFTNVKIRADNLEAYCDVVESPWLDRPDHHPIIITGTYRVSKEQRLELLFAGHVIGKALSTSIQSGSIIDRGGRVHNLKLASSLKTLNPILNSLNSWITATLAAELLQEYKGVLISDFYGGSDSLGCQQQKCLVHLIRDLNDDLWKSPFDGAYQEFVVEVRALIVPIIETVHRYGLSQAHLGCFKAQVESFYERVVLGKTYHSETTLRYQKRFKRYRMSLSTFLDYDGIPWTNNMAERALRHLVVQENISKTFYKSIFPQHLLLLGIMQPCRFRKLSFLRFLVSGEKDFVVFENNASTTKRGQAVNRYSAKAEAEAAN